eukprot:315929-Pyramimonas_sp.AAC.1
MALLVAVGIPVLGNVVQERHVGVHGAIDGDRLLAVRVDAPVAFAPPRLDVARARCDEGLLGVGAVACPSIVIVAPSADHLRKGIDLDPLVE